MQEAHSNKYSPQQQELIDVINAELSEFLVAQLDLISKLKQHAFKSAKLREVLEVQTDFVSRVGSVARMIGLKGLHAFCKHIKNNFIRLQSKRTDQFNIVASQILYWPEVIKKYLIAPSDPVCINEVLEYLRQHRFPIGFEEHELNKLKEQFYNSSIKTDKPKQISLATPELISLEVSDEISTDIIENLLLDLPKQVEKLSIAVRGMLGEDFVDQLEIATKIAHTIKGAGNIVGIQGIANFTHAMEDIFDVLLKARKKPSNMLYASLQNATDCLEEMSEYLEGIGPQPDNSIFVFQDLLDWANSISTHGLTEQIVSIDGLDQNAELETDLKQEPEKLLPIKNSERSNDDSSDLPLRVAAKLIDDLLNNTDESIVTSEQIAELVLLLKNSMQHLIANNKKVKLRAHELENLIGLRGLPESIKISGYKNTEFDPLELDQFDELHTSANQLVEEAEDAFEYTNDIQVTLLMLEKHCNNQVRNLQESQESVLRIRMVPIKSIVPRLKRAVRQACKSSNKLAELNITGEDILVDSDIIHQLADPIMHILRNSIDHGIEMPDERAKKGKNAQGNIHLAFNVEGNSIHVTCEDDGCSLDLERIRSKAIEKKLLIENEELDNEHAIQMILRHGFSTKDKISQLSGRGVGLAAVHTKVMDMKGSINIDVNDATGINVEITVPTNMNSVHALLVNSAGIKVAISNRGVDEILYSGAGEIVSVSGENYFEYMQQRYPVYDLRFMLELSKYNNPTDNNVTLITNDDAGNKYAVTIDKIYDTRDIITKPISELIPNVSGLLGTTILGDGSITNVIDIVGLLNHAKSLGNESAPIIQSKEQEDYRQHALVVEDSISTRKALAQFMQDLGFEVETAKDGVEALSKIQNKIPTIVLTDLEMPRMNGLELATHIRSNAEMEFAPIIMISSKSSIKHKHEAEQSGITAYVTKPYYEDELLETINSLNLIEHVVA